MDKISYVKSKPESTLNVVESDVSLPDASRLEVRDLRISARKRTQRTILEGTPLSYLCPFRCVSQFSAFD